jgi:putative endonuclease
VARNWRRPEGELDIVADDRGTCVFVEVRSRTGEQQGHPLESITPHKRARVIRAARLYLEAEAPAASGFRFDVVAVTFDPEGRLEPVVVYLPNAFEVP